MTRSPTHPRQITALALTIAAWLTLTPGGAFSSEPIQPTASMAVACRGRTATVLAEVNKFSSPVVSITATITPFF